MDPLSIHEFKRRAVEFGGNGIFKRSALNIRDGAGVFERVLSGGQYPVVLEIGTYRGVAAAFMAQFCERVITVDLVRGGLEKSCAGFDRRAFWHSLGLENIDLRLVADDEEKAAVVSSLSFDLAFIDGGKDDIADDFALVRRCGAVLFHDYDDRGQPALNRVFDFVNSLPRKEVKVMDIFALWRASRR